MTSKILTIAVASAVVFMLIGSVFTASIPSLIDGKFANKNSQNLYKLNKIKMLMKFTVWHIIVSVALTARESKNVVGATQLVACGIYKKLLVKIYQCCYFVEYMDYASHSYSYGCISCLKNSGCVNNCNVPQIGTMCKLMVCLFSFQCVQCNSACEVVSSTSDNAIVIIYVLCVQVTSYFFTRGG